MQNTGVTTIRIESRIQVVNLNCSNMSMYSCLFMTMLLQLAKSQQLGDCWNSYPCCDMWAAGGYCQSSYHVHFMKLACPLSCRLCQASFSTSTHQNCIDQLSNCASWAQMGYCNNHEANFMKENCRRSCRFCGVPKTTACASQPPQSECYNDDPCCNWLMRRLGCQNNHVRQVCRRSCKLCVDRISEQACGDYFPMCQQKARRGVCEQRPRWMGENCRAACGKCDLVTSNLCAGADIRIPPGIGPA